MDRENIQIELFRLARKCKENGCLLEFLFACNQCLFLTPIGLWDDLTPRYVLDPDMYFFIEGIILAEIQEMDEEEDNEEEEE